MKKGGGKILFFVFLFILGFFLNLVFVDPVFCYDTSIAHPGIAGLAVKAYNKDNTKKITAEQYDWIKQGAIDEDIPTRWLNHFYDPVYNKGLWFITQHESSKVWAKDSKAQQSYSKGDNSWQRAISDYRSGNYQLAFKELGHNIHLVSDLLVPAHTRDDIHAPKPDSYEEYVKNNWDSLSTDIKAKPIYKNKFEDIFDEAANYSNNNFYSDDTIEDKNYKVKNIDKILELKKNNEKMFLFQSRIGQELVDLYVVDGSDWKDANHKILNNKVVLSDYVQHLLPKAVSYSAGTIKLFLDETQKNQIEKLPFFKINLGGLVNTIGSKFINVAENIYQNNYSQASDNNGVINAVADNTVKQVEAIGKIINKKIVEPSSTVQESLFSASQPVSDLSAVPISNVIVENGQNTPLSSPIFSGGGGGSGGSSAGSLALPIVLNSDVAEITTTTILISVTSTFDNIITASTTNIESSSVSAVTTSIILSTSTVSTSTFFSALATSTIVTSTISETAGFQVDSTTTIGSVTTTSVTTTSAVDSVTSTTEIAVPISTSTVSTSTASDLFATTTPIISPTTTTSTVAVTITTSTPYLTPDIVINEIAWAGTSQFTLEDEYIELYNNSDQDINLFPATDIQKRWTLKISGQKIVINKINNSIIPAHDYFLLENPDDRTVTEINGDIIYAGALSDSGGNLQLFDNNNNLVDQVSSSVGWFAGSGATYSSMEKINSSLSGNNPTNWQTNQGPRLNGKVDGGGSALSLNGSPKQSNFGSIVLRGTQNETERTLKKSDYPYVLTYYEIPAGKILNIEEGVVVKAYYPDSKMDIKGTLNIVGSDAQKVVMTSDTKSPKSWQGLTFYPGSVGNLNNLDISNAGANFKLPNANMWDPKVSRAIFSDSASINILNSSFTDDGDINIYNLNTNSSISNTNFKNGLTAIEHHGGALNLNNIKVDNFSNTAGAIYVRDIWPQLSEINFSSNINGAVDIVSASITSSITIGADVPINLENLKIETTGSLTVAAGATFNLPEFSNIFIKGTLNLNGTVDNPIKFIGPAGINQYWGHLVFDGGIGSLNSVDFSGGGYNYQGDNYHGIISANNGSQVTLENCQLLDNRLPVEIIQINNSNVNLNNTSIGYSTKNTFFQNVKGVQVNSGSLSIDNSFFYNLTTGITAGSANPLPQLNLVNMDTRNFVNVDNYWDPFVWWPVFSVSP